MKRTYLEVRRGESTEAVELTGERLALGREPANAVSFPTDANVSRRHAVVECVADRWRVRDVGSSNGTYVNGARLECEHVLASGDVIRVGGHTVVFCSETPADRTAVVVADDAGHYLDLSEEWVGSSAAAAPTPAPPTPSSAAGARPPEAPQPPSAPSRQASASRQPGPPPRDAAHVRGIARSVQIRDGGENERAVLAFRVDCYDVSGNRLDPVGVELRGYRSGQVSDGDEVEIEGKWSHGTVRARKIVNRSTNADVKGAGTLPTIVGFTVLGGVVFAGILVWIAFILYLVFTS